MSTTSSGSQDDPFLTLAEIAEELRVNPATVRLWVSKGQLNATRAGMRKLIVRRSEVDRMLTSTNRAAERPSGAVLGERMVDPEPGPDVCVGEERPVSSARPPEYENAWKLVDLASGNLQAAIKLSALAPPSAGYPDRVRAIADGFEHVASTLFHSARTTDTTWAGNAGWEPELLPYELRPDGNRPARAGLWDRFDRSFTALLEAAEGTDILTVAQANRDVAEELFAVAERLGEDASQPVDWTVG